VRRGWLPLAAVPVIAVPVMWAATIAPVHEIPPPDGPWRLHQLSRCDSVAVVAGPERASLDLAIRLFEQGSGGDAVAELEACLREHAGASSVMLTLGQLYLLAARGGGSVVPREGPAAKTRDPARDRAAWLDRAATLLTAAAGLRPDDGVVDYLLAEVARDRGDLESAMATELRGMRKCSYAESLEVVRRYQRVQAYPAQVTSPIVPVYPEAAQKSRRQGRVRLDLLIDPEARVVQVDIIDGDPLLAAAAAAAAPFAGYQAARVGLYPVWAWLRVSVDFRQR
jgi:hypothetical protein